MRANVNVETESWRHACARAVSRRDVEEASAGALAQRKRLCMSIDVYMRRIDTWACGEGSERSGRGDMRLDMYV